jgi:IS1 family transposase
VLLVSLCVHGQRADNVPVVITDRINASGASEQHPIFQNEPLVKDVPVSNLPKYEKSVVALREAVNYARGQSQERSRQFLFLLRGDYSFGQREALWGWTGGIFKRIGIDKGEGPQSNIVGGSLPHILKKHYGFNDPSLSDLHRGFSQTYIGPQLFLGCVLHHANLPLNSFGLHVGVSDHLIGLCSRRFDFCKLTLYSVQGSLGIPDTQESDDDKNAGKEDRQAVNPVPRYRHGGKFADSYGILCIFIGYILTGLFIWLGADRIDSGRRCSGLLLIGLGISCDGLATVSMMIGCLPGSWHDCLCDGEQHSEYRQHSKHDGENVSQKLLTPHSFRITFNPSRLAMANVLSTDKKIAVIGALAEGSSIRSIERITGVHRDTIMRLGVKVGQGCTALMDEIMQDLPCTRLEMDEIWGFVGKKDRSVRLDEDTQVGSVWTFCAIDADTKLVPTFKVGERDTATATAFMQDVASRMRNRVQISTDGLRAYVDAVERTFGSDVDYAQIVKVYGHEETSNNRRYSAPEFVSSEKKVITGDPDLKLVSTSYVERLNATTRLHMRRLTRLTLAFSKKREKFEAAVGLHFAYYNFVKRHNTLRCTPAMAAGVAHTTWSVGDLVEAAG